MMTKLEELIRVRMERATAELEKWHSDFKENPFHALEWSRGAFLAAAEQRVFTQVLHSIHWHIENAKSDAEFKEWATKTALQKAGNIEQSSSPTANLINDYDRQAWVKVAAFNGHWL